MDRLANTVPVDKAIFSLVPTALASLFKRKVELDPDVDDLENIYVQCYRWVFETRPRDGYKRHLPFVVQAADSLGVSVKMFLLANMLGWRQTHAEFAETNKFTLARITNQGGIDCVKAYASACHEKFGTFDVTSLDRLMDSDISSKDISAMLLNSEIIFGSWIVNFKLFQSGNLDERFYREKETAMSPYWLAIEPTYLVSELQPVRDEQGVVNKLLERHRWNVQQTLGALKKSQLTGLRVFKTREKIMPEAVRRVLAQRGLLPEHFQIELVPQVSAKRFWVRLGHAIQHYECLKFVEGLPSAMDRRFGRVPKSVL